MTEQVMDNQATEGVAPVDAIAPADTAVPQSDLLEAGEKPAVESTPVETSPEDGAKFISSLSEDLRKEKSLQTFKDADSLAKSYVELNKKFGKRLEELTADELLAIDKKFGAPGSPEDYGIELPEDLKEDPILGNISERLHKAGIPKDKASALMKDVMDSLQEEIKMEATNAQLKAEEQVKAIKQEFGAAFEERAGLANKALRELGGEEAIAAIREAGLSNDPSIFRMLSKVGELISEDKPVGEKSVGNFGITPAEAAEEIARLHSDPAFLERLNDPMHPGHAEATAKRERLYRLKAGKK